LQPLTERIKLQTFWWLKSNFVTYDFDYLFWQLNLLPCLKVVM